jgi:hypothetical protein
MKQFKFSPLALALAGLGASFRLAKHGGLYSQHTFDSDLVLRAQAGADVVASQAEALIVNLGAGFVDANIVIDVTALEVASGNEIYTLIVEGSTVAGMGSGSVQLCSLELGNTSAPADADTSVGRHVLPFRNELEGVLYPYVRLYTKVAGTIDTTGVNYSAFIAKK